LPYLIAVALLEDRVMPDQYSPARIESADVQGLLRKVRVRPAAEFSERFPEELPCRLVVHLRNGRAVSKEKRNYEGFVNRPMSWDAVVEKFRALSEPHTTDRLQQRIANTVKDLEGTQISVLTDLLQQVQHGNQNKHMEVLHGGDAEDDKRQ
jgi:2-methylcitrate dehydratase